MTAFDDFCRCLQQAISLPPIEDWQLPQRYRRRPLDQQEIDYINRGGPA